MRVENGPLPTPHSWNVKFPAGFPVGPRLINRILLTLLAWPCQGFEGFHQKLTYKAGGAPEMSRYSVAGAEPPTYPMGYLNCHTDGAEAGAKRSTPMLILPTVTSLG